MTLFGVVPSPEIRAQVDWEIGQIAGVTLVDNDLRVVPQPKLEVPAEEAATDQRLRDELRAETSHARR